MRRFYVLVTASLIVMLNNSIFVAFSPISNLVIEFFGVSVFWSNSLTWVTVVSDCALAVPAIWIVHRFGCRRVFLLSSTLNFLSCAVRFFGSFSSSSSTYFVLLLIGQSLAAIAQPMLNSVPPQVSGDSFDSTERSFATAVIGTSSLVGLGVGYALFGFMVTDISVLWHVSFRLKLFLFF